ncbi:MAG: CPBP family intramembrane glutamic endopeptidase [Candidatus Hodarchaeales archaeon]|jgi:membrane protease YdiL (CAAX protease family)
MEAYNEEMTLTDPLVAKLWKKIPFLIRAIIIGVLVCEIGIITWLVTMTFIPAPWSFFIMIGAFWLYWKYFSGGGRPHSTVEARKFRFRSIKMSQDVWKWGLVAALLLVVIIQSTLVLTFRIIDFPQETFILGINYDDYPLWAVVIFIIMVAFEAGLFEEVGFRGYMQTPLERRYGAKIGIVITSIMFVVSHLHQVWAPPVLIHIFLYSALWGILAYASDSLIPGIISHTIVDIFSFSYWWSGLAERFTMQTIFQAGIDVHFIFWGIIFVLSLLVFLLTTHKLILIRQQNSESLSTDSNQEAILKLGKAVY